MVFFLSGMGMMISVLTGRNMSPAAQVLSGISRLSTVKNRKRKAFKTTETDEKLMAAAAIMGFKVRPEMP